LEKGLRGRGGRSKHQAYAYLLLPRHGHQFWAPRDRIGAINRHTRLGAGFKLALRNLEIRGAGNVLGSAQSGHIAAVGFDLYCQLLNRTVARPKGEPDRLGTAARAGAAVAAHFRLCILAAGLGIKSIATDGNRLLLGKGRDEYWMVNGKHIRLHKHGADDRLAEIEKRLRQLAGRG
jgi:transcription-repair coupling factor (superfamily II helicase)